ncbi:MAG: ribosome biogenesis GTPase Der [Actinobacteria bacterium]|nr:ribosome biogenesis GTPase Der [Actinomycetota bacterium]MCL6104422.1 ribosome biogenesis GTPase Der [Actinomycetota bacterium]
MKDTFRYASGELPLVAVVGKPNVGKSTLVNRLVGSRVTIVQEIPGVTRDRNELPCDWNGVEFLLADTGGWTTSEDSLDTKVAIQAVNILPEAQVVLFVVDVKVGITDYDEKLAALLQHSASAVLLVANKVDSPLDEPDAWQFTRLGLGDPWMVSAIHGRGSGDLLDEVVRLLAAVKVAEKRSEVPRKTSTSDQHLASVAIIGIPNAGKSTLFNRLVGEERSIVHDVPGTTRDSIDTVVATPQGRLRFIDTAGMAHKAQGIEYYSTVRALKSLELADVALLVIDASLGVIHQDQRLAQKAQRMGTAMIVVFNKWDLLDTQNRLDIVNEFNDRLEFLNYATTIRTSALTGRGVHKIFNAIFSAVDSYNQRVSTGELNKVVQSLQQTHPAPGVKIRYAIQGATRPPTFTLFASKRLHPTYLRFVEHKLRESFGFDGTPLKLRVRVSDDKQTLRR